VCREGCWCVKPWVRDVQLPANLRKHCSFRNPKGGGFGRARTFNISLAADRNPRRSLSVVYLKTLGDRHGYRASLVGEGKGSPGVVLTRNKGKSFSGEIKKQIQKDLGGQQPAENMEHLKRQIHAPADGSPETSGVKRFGLKRRSHPQSPGRGGFEHQAVVSPKSKRLQACSKKGGHPSDGTRTSSRPENKNESEHKNA